MCLTEKRVREKDGGGVSPCPVDGRASDVLEVVDQDFLFKDGDPVPAGATCLCFGEGGKQATRGRDRIGREVQVILFHTTPTVNTRRTR